MFVFILTLLYFSVCHHLQSTLLHISSSLCLLNTSSGLPVQGSFRGQLETHYKEVNFSRMFWSAGGDAPTSICTFEEVAVQCVWFRSKGLNGKAVKQTFCSSCFIFLFSGDMDSWPPSNEAQQKMANLQRFKTTSLGRNIGQVSSKRTKKIWI